MPNLLNRPTSGRSRKALQAVSALTGAGLLANGMRLRGRAAALKALGPASTSQAPDTGATDLDGWHVVAVAGAELSDEQLRRIVTWAQTEGLDAVDVVPGDLPVERLLDVLRNFDTAVYRSDPLLEGRTAGHAIVVRSDIAKRADLPASPVTPAEMIDVAREVKRYAPRTHDLVVVPDVTATPEVPAQRRAAQDVLYQRYSSLATVIPATELGVLGVGAVANPVTGLAAMAAYLVQPALVLGAAPAGVSPSDKARLLPLRWVAGVKRLVSTATATAPTHPVTSMAEDLRPIYAAELAQGLDRFFEERRTTCPWCSSSSISLKVTSPDLIQHKPGEFKLDECADCGHIFQNPRLSIEGLDFYYRDFYDGYGGGEMERIFASETEQYDGRIDMVADNVDHPPKRWLDVGTGHGHFCLVAQGRWPEASFEGADMSSSIDEAADRGWVNQGHRGMFPELAPTLAGCFDVVSMHHYLEHTREPLLELDAAVTALAPGGHLLVEVPDPECVWGRILGNRWLPWFQPQHQHFVSIGNLEKALTDRGFTVVARHRARSNQALDLVAGIWLSLGQIAPRPGMPWNGPATVGQRAWRMAVCTAALPVMGSIALVDRLLDATADKEGIGNTYRVLARLDS